MEAVEQGSKVVRPDGQHGREADRRIHGITPADPVPELEHVGGVDAELGHLRGIRRNRDEMLRHGFGIVAKARQRPVTRALSVRHRLQRRERLGRDDEQRFRGIEVAGRFHQVGAVDVGNEPERHGPVAVMLECLVGHHRPEVGAADADVDDVANAFAGVALPGAAAHPVGEVRHLVEDGVDLGHHVFAIDDDRCPFRGAQGHVQDGAVLRDVDLFTPEHGVDPRSQAGFLCQLQEELEGFVGDAILRVIEEDAHSLAPSSARRAGDHPRTASGDAIPRPSDGGLRVPSRPGAESID